MINLFKILFLTICLSPPVLSHEIPMDPFEEGVLVRVSSLSSLSDWCASGFRSEAPMFFNQNASVYYERPESSYSEKDWGNIRMLRRAGWRPINTIVFPAQLAEMAIHPRLAYMWRTLITFGKWTGMYDQYADRELERIYGSGRVAKITISKERDSSPTWGVMVHARSHDSEVVSNDIFGKVDAEILRIAIAAVQTWGDAPASFRKQLKLSLVSSSAPEKLSFRLNGNDPEYFKFLNQYLLSGYAEKLLDALIVKKFQFSSTQEIKNVFHVFAQYLEGIVELQNLQSNSDTNETLIRESKFNLLDMSGRLSFSLWEARKHTSAVKNQIDNLKAVGKLEQLLAQLLLECVVMDKYQTEVTKLAFLGNDSFIGQLNRQTQAAVHRRELLHQP